MSTAAGGAKVVPHKFFGTYKLEKSEKFDEFLASKGVPWLIRKVIIMTSITKTFAQGTAPNKYNMYNVTRKTKLEWLDWELGVAFEAKGLYGTQHRITYDVPDDNTVTEHVVRLEAPGDSAQLYTYTREGDYLVLSMKNNDITSRRFFKLEKEI